MAALIATGTSEIEHIELIDRGYERIDERLPRFGGRDPNASDSQFLGKQAIVFYVKPRYNSCSWFV